MDDFGQRIEETVGPIDEGSNVTLVCEAEGGEFPIWQLHPAQNTTFSFHTSHC